MARKKTILEIARRAIVSAKRQPPTTLFNNDPDNYALRTLIDRAGKDLLEEKNFRGEPFTVLKKQFSFTSQENISTYTLPEDFKAINDKPNTPNTCLLYTSDAADE